MPVANQLCGIKQRIMKKLTIIISAILLITQITLQAQIGQENRGRNVARGEQNMWKEGCGTPLGIFVDEITANSATIHWQSNGAKGYKVEIMELKNPSRKLTLITPLSSVAVGNLDPCKGYLFFIYAKCPYEVNRSEPQVFKTLGCD
jgi:hypothetical protein